MKFLLSLESWKLFLIVWLPPIILEIAAFFLSSPLLPPESSLLYGVYIFLGTSIWIWSITVSLYPLLPEKEKFNFKTFKICFILFVAYQSFMRIYSFFEMNSFSTNTDPEAAAEKLAFEVMLQMPFDAISMFMFFWCLLFTARMIRTLETGRNVKMGESITEAILLIMSFIGIWILQPRIRNLLQKDV